MARQFKDGREMSWERISRHGVSALFWKGEWRQVQYNFRASYYIFMCLEKPFLSVCQRNSRMSAEIWP